MKCVYCGGEDSSMENFGLIKREISAKKLLKIVRFGLENKFFRRVHFTGGEPLLRADIMHIIDSTVKMGGEVELNTNGLLLTENKIKQLRKIGCSLLKISLDCVRSQGFSSITGVNGYKKIIKTIKMASEVLPVRVNCVIMKRNMKSIIPLINLMSKIGVPEIHFLDLTYYPAASFKKFWEREFIHVSHKVRPFIEEKVGKKFKEISVFGCTFYKLVIKGVAVVLKEANPTMRNYSFCPSCQTYCHEGIFTLRLSAGGYLNICPIENTLGIDAIDALRKGVLAKELEKFSKIFDNAKSVYSFSTFLGKNNLEIKRGRDNR